MARAWAMDLSPPAMIVVPTIGPTIHAAGYQMINMTSPTATLDNQYPPIATSAHGGFEPINRKVDLLISSSLSRAPSP